MSIYDEESEFDYETFIQQKVSEFEEQSWKFHQSLGINKEEDIKNRVRRWIESIYDMGHDQGCIDN